MELTMLGGLAEFERSLIIARTSAGRATAKASGTKFGRKRKLTPHQARKSSVESMPAKAKSPWLARSTSTKRPFRGW
jgi:DNA invertase Pin-like site-specific DNA recombinase